MQVITSPTSTCGTSLRVDDTTDYGPADLVITPKGAWMAATIAITMIGEDGFDCDAVKAFCAQWPEGPQPKPIQ